jgi:hypothetical protein
MNKHLGHERQWMLDLKPFVQRTTQSDTNNKAKLKRKQLCYSVERECDTWSVGILAVDIGLKPFVQRTTLSDTYTKAKHKRKQWNNEQRRSNLHPNIPATMTSPTTRTTRRNTRKTVANE